MTKVLTRHAAFLQGATLAFLRPLLAMDAKVDLTPAFVGLSRKNYVERKNALLGAVATATTDKMAKDANIEDFASFLDQINDDCEDMPEGADADPETDLPMTPEQMAEMMAGEEDKDGAKDDDISMEKLIAFLTGKLSDEDLAAVRNMVTASAAAEPDPATDEDDPHMKPDMVSKSAMDAAISEAVKTATTNATKVQRDIQEALRTVRPYVGEMAIAFDSAEGVLRGALDIMKVEHKDIHPSALPAILKAQPLPGAKRTSAAPALAADAAAAKSFAERYPAASAIRQV